MHLAPGTVSVLEAHRERQARERAAAGEAYHDQGLVFASEIGRLTYPRNLERAWYMLLERVRREQAHKARDAGQEPKEGDLLPKIRLHDLRHTAASLMARKGASLKIIADVLGHEDEAFTSRTYMHLYDEQRDEAALDLSDLFRRASGQN
ncbi:tyrosine-type recombinase/integrase [Deinococcus yavapaiensis]|uniref:tyrosine-type recombinase/integrase n=1 Tax=Deinococcus yavapaiensis TaxID=309889 RepID=UPI00319E2F96